MDKPTIGIRIANGTYFPVLGEDERKKKRVILTPVRETQKDVKIDLFRGESEGMLNPVYVASLILNNIDQSPDSQAEIQLVVGVNDDGVLDAEAFEPLSGVKQFLSISLDSIEENADFYNMPDSEAEEGISDTGFSASMEDEDFFENTEEEFPDDQNGQENDDSGFGDDDFETDEEQTGLEEDESASLIYEAGGKCEKRNRLLKAAVVVLSIVFLILLAMLLYTLFMKPTLADENSVSEPVVAAAQEKPVIQPAPEKSAPVVEKPVPVAEKPAPQPAAAPVPAAAEKKPEPVSKPKDIVYRIKWGDTLWDISGTYYRTPWRYKKIASDNKIKNPDLIYAGSKLTIKAE